METTPSAIFLRRNRRWVRRVLEAAGSGDLAGAGDRVTPGALGSALETLRRARDELAATLARGPLWGRRLRLRALELGCDVAAEFLRLDARGELATADEPPEQEREFPWPATRPPLRQEFDQLACTPASALRRARILRREMAGLGRRVLLLGDDDLVSLPLTAAGELEVHVLDIDEGLLRWLERHARGLHLHRADLREGIPEDLLGRCDAVHLDPHWFLRGLRRFLRVAQLCLVPRRESRVFLNHCASFLGRDYPRIGRLLARYGLGCHRLVPHLSWYDLTGLGARMRHQLVLAATHRGGSRHPLLSALAHQPYIASHFHVLRLDRPELLLSWRGQFRRGWHSA